MPKRMGEFSMGVHQSGGSICCGVVRRDVAQSGQRIYFGGQPLPLPAPFGESSSSSRMEDSFGIDVLLESWSKSMEGHQRKWARRSINQKLALHQCKLPGGDEAGPSNQPPTSCPLSKELNSETARQIIVQLELDAETNVNNLREWVGRLREDKNLLKTIIREYLPRR
ncbi:hypothetical protein ACH5RR_032440 [Cinchona calisaya]|uniref:Uncharacterized protein n=1 Tax=Cinchona calisaya TaxID=153742 RepID=A0ABD2YI49_9GENT